MPNAKQTIVVTVLICAGFENICSHALGAERPSLRKPTVRELLDIYRERMDRIKSYICETETVYTGRIITLRGGRQVPNEGIAPRTEEFRIDGERFYICQRDPTGLGPSDRVVIPNDRRTRTWLWDGEYYYFCGRRTKEYAHEYTQKYVSEPLREQFINRAMCNATIYVNVEEPDTARMIAQQRPALPDYSQAYNLLNHASEVRVSDKTETINGSKCYVVEMEIGKLKSKLWIDPAHGYLIARRIDRSAHGKYYEMADATFQRFAGIWFVAQKDFQYFDSGGRWSEDRSRYRLTRFVLNPDHDELKSFETSIAEGAEVRLSGAEGVSRRQQFTWAGGKVVDADGKQINLADVRPLPGLVGQPLPQLGQIGLSGRGGRIQNRPILVCFWDMEQRSSRNCVLELKNKSAALAHRGIFVVLVHARTVEQGTLEAWIKKSGISLVSVRIAADAESVRRRWRVKAEPWLILTDTERIVRAEGFAPAELDAKINEIAPAANAPVGSSKVTGLAKDPQGQALSDVRVTELRTDKEYVTDTEGKFVTAYGQSDKRRFFFAVHKQRRLVGTGQLAVGQRHVEINLVPAKIVSGTVVDPDGKPVAGAHVAPLPMTNLHALTDSNGEFDVGWDPQWARDLKEFFIMARHVGRNLAGGLEFDEDTETVHIKLEPGLALTGTVEDPNGIPIAGARVGLSLRRGWACGTPVKEAVTDAQGRYQFRALPQMQEYINWANAEGYWQNGIKTGIINRITDREEVGPIILKKPNLSVSGVVIDDARKPVAGCRVGVRGEGQPDRMTETDAEGKFTLEKICSGRIEIWAKLDNVLYGTVETQAGQKDVKLVASPIH